MIVVTTTFTCGACRKEKKQDTEPKVFYANGQSAFVCSDCEPKVVQSRLEGGDTNATRQTPKPQAVQVPAANDELVNALQAIAQGQQEIIKLLSKKDKPVKSRGKTARR